MNKHYLFGLGLIALIVLVALYSLSGTTLKGKVSGEACTQQYQPVCGVNGITYGNSCMAQETEIAYTGECLTPNPEAICTEEYAPVCGIDGKTYPNRCDAETRNGIKVLSQGACIEGTFPAGSPIPDLSDEELASS